MKIQFEEYIAPPWYPRDDQAHRAQGQIWRDQAATYRDAFTCRLRMSNGLMTFKGELSAESAHLRPQHLLYYAAGKQLAPHGGYCCLNGDGTYGGYII